MHSRQSSRIFQTALYAHRIASRVVATRRPRSFNDPTRLGFFPHSVVKSMRTFLTVFVRTRPCVSDKNHASFASVSLLRSHRLRVFVRPLRSVHALVRGYAPCLLVSRAREASRDGREAVLVTEDDGRIRSDRWRFIFFFFWGGKKCPKVSYCSSYYDVYHFPIISDIIISGNVAERDAPALGG